MKRHPQSEHLVRQAQAVVRESPARRPRGSAGGGGGAPLLCRVYARNWREQRILVDPIRSDTDPSQCGVDGGLDVWSESEYETYFDTAARFVAWAGNNTMPAVGDSVLVIAAANCALPTAIILHKLHPNLPAPGTIADPVYADLETRCAEPCEDLVAYEDPTWITVLGEEADCTTAAVCEDVNPVMHGGCIHIGPVIIDENDPYYVEPPPP